MEDTPEFGGSDAGQSDAGRDQVGPGLPRDRAAGDRQRLATGSNAGAARMQLNDVGLTRAS